MSILIADISHYDNVQSFVQPQPTVAGLICKAIEGISLPDSTFTYRANNAPGAGLLFGAYQFFSILDDPIEQAQRFFDIVEPFLPMLLAVDLEAGQLETSGGGWAKDGNVFNVKSVQTFLDKMGQLVDGRLHVYTSNYFMVNYLKGLDLSANPLWVTDPKATAPKLPPNWKDWSLWQYDFDGIVPGIIGDVDMNIFRGSASDFRALYCKGR